jgi:hypothetical protein
MSEIIEVKEERKGEPFCVRHVKTAEEAEFCLNEMAGLGYQCATMSFVAREHSELHYVFVFIKQPPRQDPGLAVARIAQIKGH